MTQINKKFHENAILPIPSFIPPLQGVYLVGGTIRDLLLGRTPKDYDLVALTGPAAVARAIARPLNGHVIPLGKPGKMVFRIVAPGLSIDVSPVVGDTILEDLRRRDFTINAMAASLEDGRLVDSLDGLSDLQRQTIRMVARENFDADPLRLLRAYRFGATLGFSIDPDTQKAIGEVPGRICACAGERIQEEWFKLLKAPNTYPYLRLMDGSNLLNALFPELGPLKSCQQNRFHHYDVFEHTFQAFAYLEKYLADDGFMGLLGKDAGLCGELGARRRVLLKHALLLHDIGKPATRTVDAGGGVHFYGHEAAGADLSLAIGERLRLSNRDIAYTDFLIRGHLKPLSLFTAFKNNTLTPKGLARFFMRCDAVADTAVMDLFIHATADILGKGIVENASAFTAFARDVLYKYTTAIAPLAASPPLISGRDLIAAFGLSPSPLFSRILRQVEEERLSGAIHTREQALAVAKKLITAHNLS